MTFGFTPYAILLLASALVLAALAFYAFGRRGTPGAMAFALLMLAACEWKLTHALGLGAIGLSAKVFWAKAAYLGVVALPPAWLAFALHYTGLEKRWLTRLNLALLSVVPLLTLTLVWTNGAHGMVWSSVVLDASGPFPILEKEHGAWFWANVAYSYLLLLLGTALLVVRLVRSSRLYRRQGAALLVGALLPWVANGLYVSGWDAFANVNPTAFTFPLTGALFAWALFRLRLLDLVPVARDALVESMGDGVIVLDSRDRVVDLNPAALRILGRTAAESLGQSVARLVPERVVLLLGRLRGAEEAREEVTLGEGTAGRHYELALSALEDGSGRPAGRLLLLRDVTGRKRSEEALREGEERYRAVVEQTADGIYLLDVDTRRVVEANAAFAELLGYAPEELPGMTALDFVTQEREELELNIRRTLEERRRFVGERRYRRKDGSVTDVDVNVSAIHYGGRDVICAAVRDVTERKKAEEALRKSERRFRQLFENSVDALLVHDETGRMVDCNAEACRSLGYSREELLSLSVDDFGIKLVSDEEGLDKDRMLWERVMDDDPGTVAGVVLGMHRRKDGTTFPVEVRLSGVDYGGRRLILASCRDLTERRALEGRLAHMAFHDYLTGLPNRALFAERLSRTLGRDDRDGEPVCLLFLDLDGFKEVNDRHGHEAGDALLAAAAGRIKRCLRPSDTAARMGGDEFAVLLEGLGPERAREVAARIGEALGSPFAVGGEEARVGASVGVACAFPGEKDAAELLGEADREMYRAKERRHGRGHEGARRRED